MSVDHDLTERRVSEERLMHLEKMESIGRLAGGIAHDFNNLLTAILGYTELLLSHRSPDDPDRPDLEEIQKAGQRAGALTRQLLAFSRRQTLVPQQVDLNQTVSGMQPMLARLIREDITLTCDVAPKPAIIRIDPAHVEQTVLNLVLNARDALGAGGWIRLEVAVVPQSEVQLDAEAIATMRSTTGAEQYVRLRVSHGFIGFTSQSGDDTTTMYFPAVPLCDVAAQAPSAPVEELAPGHETILLVEDEEAVRMLVSTVLRRLGYSVLETSKPLEACGIFEREGAAIDLLVTDIVMPDMNGPALAQRLVAIRPELRVLFISGYAGIPTPQMQNRPNVGFLNKPFQTSVLASRVREMLSRPARPRAVEGR